MGSSKWPLGQAGEPAGRGQGKGGMGCSSGNGEASVGLKEEGLSVKPKHLVPDKLYPAGSTTMSVSRITS